MHRPDQARFPRRMRRRHLLGLLAGLATGCSVREPRPLRVGISGYPPYELMMLARESGFFREAGVEVRLLEFEDLSDAQRAYEQGKLDGLATTLVEVLVTRHATGRDLRILRVISVSEGADVILAPRAIRSVADLRGRKVAVELASLSHFLLARALERSGMALSDVTTVSMAQPVMAAALRRGEVSAVVTYPPNSQPLHADPAWHVLFSSSDIPDEVVDVYAFDDQAITQRAGELRAFFSALDRAFERLRTAPAESCNTMAPREQMSGEAFCAALSDGIRLVPPSGQARYLGPAQGLAPHVDAVARALARNRLISVRPGLLDCLEPLQP